jgi:two-component system sensor histidine kinase/response regulator
MEERPKILVVDDDPDHRLVLLTMLMRHGFAVTEAPTAEEGLEHYRSESFDIILLDIMLPGMDGMELLAEMRVIRPQDEAPVVFVSAVHDSNTIRKGLELGAIEYLTKPVDYDELQVRMGTLMRLRRLQQQVREDLAGRAEQRAFMEVMVTLAHHINNAAMTTLMRCDLVHPDDPAEAAEFRDLVRDQTQKIVNVVRSLQEVASSQQAAGTKAYSTDQAMIDLRHMLEAFKK